MSTLCDLRDAGRLYGVRVQAKPNVSDALLMPCPKCGSPAEVMEQRDGEGDRAGRLMYWCDCQRVWHPTSAEELKRHWERQGQRPTGDTEQKPGDPAGYARTDAGNAECFRDLCGEIARYVHQLGTWRLWDGRRWRDDVRGAAEQLALLAARHRLELAASVSHDGERADEAKWALRSENVSKRRDLLAAAATLPELASLPGDFDKYPWALNCENGLLDLHTGVLRAHQPEGMCSKLVPVTYDPEAKCPSWERFLLEVFDGSEGLVRFVQRAVGYSLTGDTREQCLFLLHGSGCNGKSVFLRVLLHLLADYGAATDFATLTLDRERQAGIRNDVARLAGVRLATASETSEGVRFSEGVLKQLTGEDRVTARFLHREFFEFTPQFKLWLACNHRPRVRDSSDSFWRRIRLIPFAVSFRGREDKGLARELLTELPGMLAWAVRGCREWREAGDLQPPREVLVATDQYRQAEDALAQFLAECCVTGDGLWASAGELYRAYCSWCESGGERPASQRRFGEALAERGFERLAGTTRETRGRIQWLGLGLLDEPEGAA